MEPESRLLHLPREVRDKIMVYACENQVIRVQAKHLEESKSDRPRPGLRYDTRLLLINRQLCEEAKTAAFHAYTKNTLHFESSTVLQDFVAIMPGPDVAKIRRLHLKLARISQTIDHLRHWFFLLSDVLADQFHGLEHLYICKDLRYRNSGIPPQLLNIPLDSHLRLTSFDSGTDKDSKTFCRIRRVKKPDSKPSVSYPRFMSVYEF